MPSVPGPDKCMEIYDGISQIIERSESGEHPVDPLRISHLKKRLADRELTKKLLFEVCIIALIWVT